MNRTYMRTLGLVAMLTAATPAAAQERLGWFIRAGGDHGGDTLLEFVYADGSTPEVTAGGGGLLTGGADVRLLPVGLHALHARLSGGVKYRTIPPATNQEASWIRFPVEAMALFRSQAGFALGAGPVVHLRNALTMTGEVENSRIEFRSLPGFLVQGEYSRREWGLDLRYTALTYEVEGSTSRLSASSIGGGFSYYFGRAPAAAAGTR